MKRTLQQVALRFSFVRAVFARRSVLHLRALLRPLREPSSRHRLQRLRRDLGQLLRIEPIAVAQDRHGFEAGTCALLPAIARRDAEVLRGQAASTFRLRRFCLCCNEARAMLVDRRSGWQAADGSRTPNWRESLVCDLCGMNNRQRLVAKLVQQCAAGMSHPSLYLMEQVTPIFDWVRRLPGVQMHGSEYLGHEHVGGTRIDGVRHEDVMNLSYLDAAFDIIASNDVLEHIPDPARAWRECFRVLKPGGILLATFPFDVGHDTTVARARLVGGTLEHLLVPTYHGNPLSSGGSLVFHDFGWDLLDTLRAAGFPHPACELYARDEFGHLGPGLLVFRLVKPVGDSS